MKKKTFALLLSLVLVFGVIAGGTLAWLIDKTDPVTNTFTVGDINIDLDESENLDLKMVPGTTITKDPKVIVEANSEACYLFVKVEKKNWNDNLSYTIADGWTALTGVDGVYYREVSATTAKTEFPVLKDNQVTVSNALLKGAFDGNDAPQLIFTAYACQKANVATAADAWANIGRNGAPATNP